MVLLKCNRYFNSAYVDLESTCLGMEEVEVTACRQVGRPAGKRKTSNWDAVRRRARSLSAVDHGGRQSSTAAAVSISEAAAQEAVEEAVEAAAQEAVEEAVEEPMLELISKAFWTTNFEGIFEAEIIENERLCGSSSELPASSYRRRLKGAAAAEYDRRRRNQRRDQMAVQLHANNQQHWSPSLVARSIAYYRKWSRFIQANETRQRRLASKPTVSRVLKLMMQHKPRPVWKQGVHVKCFAYDQTYQWIGVKKRGHRKSVERLDSAGMPLEIKHMVYINSISVALPDSLGTLSASDLQLIQANHGSAYTEPYNNILIPLHPDAVERSLIDFARDVCASVDQVYACIARHNLDEHSHTIMTCVSVWLLGRLHFLMVSTSQRLHFDRSAMGCLAVQIFKIMGQLTLMCCLCCLTRTLNRTKTTTGRLLIWTRIVSQLCKSSLNGQMARGAFQEKMLR